jgi:hypothetical protein
MGNEVMVQFACVAGELDFGELRRTARRIASPADRLRKDRFAIEIK